MSAIAYLLAPHGRNWQHLCWMCPRRTAAFASARKTRAYCASGTVLSCTSPSHLILGLVRPGFTGTALRACSSVSRTVFGTCVIVLKFTLTTSSQFYCARRGNHAEASGDMHYPDDCFPELGPKGEKGYGKHICFPELGPKGEKATENISVFLILCFPKAHASQSVCG